MELYVWWHVAGSQQGAAVEATRQAQQQALKAAPGLTARLLIRSEPGRDRATLMEVYAAPHGIGPAHRAALDSLAARLLPLAASGRHEEWFEPVA